jgi:hypothetical protein
MKRWNYAKNKIVLWLHDKTSTCTLSIYIKFICKEQKAKKKKNNIKKVLRWRVSSNIKSWIRACIIRPLSSEPEYNAKHLWMTRPGHQQTYTNITTEYSYTKWASYRIKMIIHFFLKHKLHSYIHYPIPTHFMVDHFTVYWGQTK